MRSTTVLSAQRACVSVSCYHHPPLHQSSQPVERTRTVIKSHCQLFCFIKLNYEQMCFWRSSNSSTQTDRRTYRRTHRRGQTLRENLYEHYWTDYCNYWLNTIGCWLILKTILLTQNEINVMVQDVWYMYMPTKYRIKQKYLTIK